MRDDIVSIPSRLGRCPSDPAQRDRSRIADFRSRNLEQAEDLAGKEHDELFRMRSELELHLMPGEGAPDVDEAPFESEDTLFGDETQLGTSFVGGTA